jgi:hypothetical protein
MVAKAVTPLRQSDSRVTTTRAAVGEFNGIFLKITEIRGKEPAQQVQG